MAGSRDAEAWRKLRTATLQKSSHELKRDRGIEWDRVQCHGAGEVDDVKALQRYVNLEASSIKYAEATVDEFLGGAAFVEEKAVRSLREDRQPVEEQHIADRNRLLVEQSSIWLHEVENEQLVLAM